MGKSGSFRLMLVADIKKNDIIDGTGICVSLWAQGCPFHCKGCHNQSTWSFDKGTELKNNTLIQALKIYLDKNGVKRNFSILGGEPLSKVNLDSTLEVLKAIHEYFKGTDRKIYLWTGYTFEELKYLGGKYTECLKYVDVLIEGRYKEELRDISLPLRGSSNQRIITREELERYL